MKVASIFSGIGAFEQALLKMDIKSEIIFACDNGERELDLSFEDINNQIDGLDHSEIKEYIDKLYKKTGKENFVMQSYLANYKIDHDRFYQDVRFLNATVYRNNIDVLVGGSPCQSFSISGKRGGLEDTRGTLFYDFARIVSEAQPKVFIYENVPGLLSHDKGKTWDTISNVFDDLNYDWDFEILNSKDYGIPQNRRRVFVIGYRKDLGEFPKFPKKIELENFAESFLEAEVKDKYFLKEKGFKWVTKPETLSKRVSINSDICRTQTANQQFNWCGDMIFIKNSEDFNYSGEGYIGRYKQDVGVVRKMTPRECLRLMGFSDKFKIVVPDTRLYRQSGNSMVVNVLENLLVDIIEKIGK